MLQSVMINIRVNKNEKEWLKQQAKLEGKTLSAFLRDAAIEQAHKILNRKKGR